VLHHFQPDLVLGEQLRQLRYRRLVGDQAINQADRAKANHRVAAKFTGVSGEDGLSGIGDNGLGNAHFLVVEIQQATV